MLWCVGWLCLVEKIVGFHQNFDLQRFKRNTRQKRQDMHHHGVSGRFWAKWGPKLEIFFLSFLCFLWWDGPLCASINAKTRQMCLRVAGTPAHANRQNDKNKHICLVFAFIEKLWRYRAKRVSYYSIWRCFLAKAGYILRMGYYSYRGDTPRRSQ